jgi:glyoxylate carboligase
MTKMTGSQAIVEALKMEKVKQIFGIPGGSTLPLYDVLYDAGIQDSIMRSEDPRERILKGLGALNDGGPFFAHLLKVGL